MAFSRPLSREQQPIDNSYEKWTEDGLLRGKRMVRKTTTTPENELEVKWRKSKELWLYCGALATKQESLYEESLATHKRNRNIHQREWDQIVFFQSGSTQRMDKNSTGVVSEEDVVAVILAQSRGKPEEYLNCFLQDNETEIADLSGEMKNNLISALVTLIYTGDDTCMRIYIPYNKLRQTFRPRLRCACCSKYIEPLPTTTFKDISNDNFIGFKVEAFTYLKFYAVASEIPKEILFTGKRTEKDLINRGSKIIIHEKSCTKLATVSYVERHINSKTLQRIRTECEEVKNVSSVLCSVCVERPETERDLKIDIEIPILKEDSSSNTHNDISGRETPLPRVKFATCVRNRWRTTETQTDEDKYVYPSPRGKMQDKFIAFEVDTDLSDQDTCKAAEVLSTISEEDIVRMIMVNKFNNPRNIKIECVERSLVYDRLANLQIFKFEAADQSGEFRIKDCELITLDLTGNVMCASEDGPGVLQYHRHYQSAASTFFATAATRSELLNEGEGFLTWEVSDNEYITGRKGKLAIQLEKKEEQTTEDEDLSWCDIGLSKFIAKLVTEDRKADWSRIFGQLQPRLKDEINQMLNLAEDEKTNSITLFITRWMKSVRRIKRMQLLFSCLEEKGNKDFAQSIKDFYSVYTAIFSDESISKMVRYIGNDYRFIGIGLGVKLVDIEKMEMDHGQVNLVILHMLAAARLCDTVINNGRKLKEFFIEQIKMNGGNPELLFYVENIMPKMLNL